MPSSSVSGLSSGARPKITNTFCKKKQKSMDIFSIPDNGEFEVPSSSVSGLSSGARPKITNTFCKKKQKSMEKAKNNQSKTNHSKSNVEQRKKESEGFER